MCVMGGDGGWRWWRCNGGGRSDGGGGGWWWQCVMDLALVRSTRSGVGAHDINLCGSTPRYTRVFERSVMVV